MKVSNVAAITLFGIGAHFWSYANAQNPNLGSVPGYGSNFASRLADSIPIGSYGGGFPIGGIIPSEGGIELGPDDKLSEGLKGGFAYGLGLASIYDSNFFLSENNPEGELGTSFYGIISYLSDPEGGAPFSIVANYNPVIQTYLENPDNNGFNQSGDVSMTLKGSKTLVSTFINLTQTSGTDPVIGEFATESLLSWGLSGSYQVAPRTQVAANFSAASSVFEENTLEGADIYTTDISGSWAATEYLSLGPVIRYNMAKSDNTGTRDAWQALLQAGYRVGERIQIGGSLGVDYATDSRDDGSSTVGLTGNFSGRYAITEKLGWSGSVVYVTVPSPNETDYVVNNLTFSTGLTREFLRASGSVGLVLNVASYEGVGAVNTPLDDENNLNIYASYSRAFFLEQVSFIGTLLYAVNDGQSEWTQVQLSLGLNVQF